MPAIFLRVATNRRCLKVENISASMEENRMSLSVEEKKQAIRDLYEKGFNARNLDYLDQVFGASYVDHSSSAPGTMDRDSFKQFIGMHFEAFPDIRFEVEGDIVAEGDYVAWRD